jgi:Cof subfamily protein (haloacid dehalogenase superfamily)
MDDTLLDSKKIISPRTREAIRQAARKGVTVTIATGRSFLSALPYAKQLNLDVPIITYNGALIKAALSGEIFWHRPVSSKAAAALLALCREHNWYIQVYTDDVLYIKEHNEKSAFYEKSCGINATAVGEKLYSMEGEPTKMLIMEEPAKIADIKNVIDNRLKGSITLTTSHPRFLEINRHGINKGVALSYLANRFNIEHHEVMAIGDSLNDLDMIKAAGFGVAMGNAVADIKQAAEAVTGGHDADGVAEAIEKYVLR